MVIAAISFFVMVWGYFIHSAPYGFAAMWVFAFCFIASVFLCISHDEEKGIINHDKRLGL